MKRIIFVTTLTTLSLSLAVATALASTGRTADGCTYKIINGQYLTSCPPKAGDRIEQVAAAPAAVPASAPVTSYGAVPVRNNPEALVPSVQAIAIATPAQSSLVKAEALDEEKEEPFFERAYVGANLGSTNISEAGSSTGLGLTVGTDIDEHFGVELGYNYTSQGLFLGLDTRGNSLGNSYPVREDATLKSHLISGELQGFATRSSSRLRPYLGAGLGMKFSSLTEKSMGLNGESANGSISQSTFGGIGSAGAKFRVGKGFQLGLGIRYFLPFVRSESKLEQERSRYGSQFGNAPSRLTKADDFLTGASQYQLQGGLEYTF